MTTADRPDDLDAERFSPWQLRAREHERARRAVKADLSEAMARARQLLAEEDDCRVQTRVRYERETARVLAALHDTLAAEGGGIKLVVEMPGHPAVDLLYAPGDELEGYTTPRTNRAHDLDTTWRKQGNRRS